jgi:hypothetical protein
MERRKSAHDAYNEKLIKCWSLSGRTPARKVQEPQGTVTTSLAFADYWR